MVFETDEMPKQTDTSAQQRAGQRTAGRTTFSYRMSDSPNSSHQSTRAGHWAEITHGDDLSRAVQNKGNTPKSLKKRRQFSLTLFLFPSPLFSLVGTGKLNSQVQTTVVHPFAWKAGTRYQQEKPHCLYEVDTKA